MKVEINFTMNGAAFYNEDGTFSEPEVSNLMMVVAEFVKQEVANAPVVLSLRDSNGNRIGELKIF